MSRPGPDPGRPGGDPGAVPPVYPAGGAGGFPDPAHPGAVDPAAAGLRSEMVEEGVPASALSALVFLAGVWLVLAPFALDYPERPGGFDGRWNDIVVGVAVAAVALVRMVAPIRTVTIGLINIGLGAWLVAAPFVLFYNDDEGVAPSATVNDLVVGIVIVALATASMVVGRWARIRRREPGSPAQAPRRSGS